MVSKKRSAQKRQIEEFKASFSADAMDDIFAREDERQRLQDEEREELLRYKACEKKNRYRSRSEAEEAIASCAEYGTRNLHCYKCDYCHGWHLTSHAR